MADFVAVLRKAIGALGENTPEMREKVYDKARSTIEAKLAALTPQPPAAVIARQRKALDDAIAVVRSDHEQPAESEKDAGLEDVFASLKTAGDIAPAPAPAIVPAATPAPLPPDPVLDALPPAPAREAKSATMADDGEEQHLLRGHSEPTEPLPAGGASPRPPARKRVSAPTFEWRSRTALLALLALIFVAGGVYFWLGSGTAPDVATAPAPAEDVVTTAEELGEETAPAEESAAAEGQQEIAALPPEEKPAPAPAADVEKFTQRLLPDGSEVDEGPAGGQSTIGEGTSMAVIAPQDEPGTSQDGQQATPAAPQTQDQEPQPAVAVGQRAIFYEERTSSTQGSAELGSIVWSVVQESPGGDLPPEPAIRAEATIPGKDIQLRMTVRRNGDESLPAGHIVEMIFLTPEGFEGGAIANVSRIALKETEQAAGNPLVGIPAKIADGFFLIALSDAPAEVQTNMTLLRRQNWLDIPIVYQSGRRALLSLEKGIPGDRAFQEALTAWEAATAG